ncbi:MAG: lipoprotein-releasing ABC transporter permease subunit [Magnetococcales bacterium]|nr:lipoprotein-releasing ABC transporter permease subunit [Magnetococcales bacterium]
MNNPLAFWNQRFEWVIGLRYLRAKRGEFFISVITALSMGGVVLGVAALITVLAVMTGFREELQRQILGVTSHVTVRAPSGNLEGAESLISRIRAIAGVVAVAPYTLHQAMISSQGRSFGVVLRGMDPELETKVSALGANIRQGKLEGLPKQTIILGGKLARNLQVELGDRVTLTIAVSSSGDGVARPRMEAFQVAAVFESGMHEYDNAMAYIRIDDAQRLMEMGRTVTGIEMLATTPDTAPLVAQSLRGELGKGYWIRDWMEMNRNFFRILQMQKSVLFVILLLVVLVAAFNIISSLIMVVMEKGGEIAILKTMGARASSILTIFMIHGGIIGAVGTTLGTLLGLLLSWNLEQAVRGLEKLLDIQLISGEVYFIDHLPARVVAGDVAWVAGSSLVITLVATLYPAWRAARVDPVEALRHE